MASSPTPERAGAPSPEMFGAYLQHLRARDLSPNTITAYRTDLEEFAEYCARSGVEPIDADAEVVRGFLASRTVLGRARTSVARKASALRGYYRFCRHHAEARFAPAERAPA
jgi:site-specific recombinase XerD